MNRAPLVLILAGGEGRRIGGDKPLRELAGRTLIEHAMGMARRWSDGQVVIAGNPQDRMGAAGALFVEDAPGLAGPLAGLLAGLEFTEIEGAEQLLCLPVDAPFLPCDLHDRLRSVLESHGGAGCAMACSGGRKHPTCALWRVAEARAAVEVVQQGDKHSLMRLAETVGHCSVEWPIEGNADPFFNINSVEHLAIAEKLIEQG